METSKLIEKFEFELRGRKYRENSIKNYVSCVALFLSKYKDRDSLKHISEQDIKKWTNVDLTNYVHLQAERDRFLVSYYFLLRFGDSLRFDKSNFFKDGSKWFMRIRHEKTNKEVIVPVKPSIYKILKCYDFKLPKISNTTANSKLREIGLIAKITTLVNLNGETKPKYLFINTHTARRSGATNLYLQGVEENTIMHLGGWERVQTFRTYIRVTRLESAIIASKLKHYR